MLNDAGYEQSPLEDIDTEKEKVLGRLVKEKYNTDFYIMYEYPRSARPFYTMPHPTDPNLTNSYDMFIRGEEIISGAQRIHDPKLLLKRATEEGVDIEKIRHYVDSFKWGSYPHGGGGFGLERLVMNILGLDNIRKASIFYKIPDV